MFNANYAYMNAYYPRAYFAQPRGSFKWGGYSGGRTPFFGRGNMNYSPRMFNGGVRNGYGRGFFPRNNSADFNHFSAPRNPVPKNSSFLARNGANMSGSQGSFNNAGELVCQICFKNGHTADVCWHRFVEDFVPVPRGFGREKTPRAAYFSNFDGSTSNPDFGYENNNMFPGYDSISGNSYYSRMDGYTSGSAGTAFMANFEGTVDDGWYLDSGATHHLTNNMVADQWRV